jgi:DNA-binding NarL/FixJ family response regulator
LNAGRPASPSSGTVVTCPGAPERALASAAVSVEPPRALRRSRCARADRAPASSGLTEREHQVLELLAGGLTNRRIAKTLFISEKTVSAHVARILAKFQVSNRSEAGGGQCHGRGPAEDVPAI